MHIPPYMIVIALLMGSLSAYLALQKKRNPYTWFFLGFLFGLIGILAIFFVPAPRPKRRTAPTPKPTPPKIVGPKNKFWYYLDVSRVQQGPMSFDALTRAFHQGKISPSTYVWHEELSDWKRLQELTTRGAHATHQRT